MMNYLKASGWLIAIVLFVLLLLQRSCEKPCPSNIQGHDIVSIPGDHQLIKVQDKILEPVKIIHSQHPKNKPVDTAAVLRDYFDQKVYSDTIRSRDVVAVIKDSIVNNGIRGRQVFIENKRQTFTNAITPKNKIFVGGFFGWSRQNPVPSAGVSVIFLSKKDALYQYSFDAVNRTHSLGMFWKIHLGK